MSSAKRKRSTLVKAESSPPPPPPPKPLSSYSPSETLKSWFENLEWSDLTIELSDGRRTPVHKSVLCSRNEYFDGMFGLKCPAADQKRKNIKLESDEPEAVRGVIRKIYGWNIECENTPGAPCWKYWFELIKVAAKFLEPELASDAENQLYSYVIDACRTGRIDGVCDILHRLHELDSRPQAKRMIASVAGRTQRFVRDNERLREYLFSHPEVMMGLIESRT